MENDNEDVDDKTDFKQNLTGYVYQLKLLLLFLWRGLESGSRNKFQLGTELKEAEKFDDAIFFYERAAKTFVRYMQAKYSRFDNKVLEFKDFETGWSQARCNLKKYFISYRKIKQRPYQEELDDLIICTNIPFKTLTLAKNKKNYLTFDEVKYCDEIFNGMKKYQLKNFTTAPKIHDELKQCTNLNLLAKELVNCIFKTTKGFNLDLQNYWISAYFNALIKERVIEEREYYKLARENENPQSNFQKLRNQEIRKFRRYFVEKMVEKNGFANENVKFVIKDIDKLRNHTGRGSATLEETAEILAQYGSKNGVLTLPNKSFDKLDNFIAYEKSYVFIEKFICGDNFPGNPKTFRDALLKACEKEVTKILPGQQIYATNALNGIKIFETNSKSSYHKRDEEDIAKELVHHIFYKKKLINIFKPKYAFLKNVFDLVGMNTLQFTKDFAKNDNGNFRKMFLKLYAQEKLKNTIFKFKQGNSKTMPSSYESIITQLKTSYDDPQTKTKKILKFDQTNWKKDKMEGLIEALNGSIFIATKERDKIQFKDNLMGGTLSNKIAEKFKTDLKAKFGDDFTNLKDYKIEYINYPPHFDQLTEESTPINNDIETFRKKLFIVITPSETQLMADITNEMGDQFNLLDGDTITFNLFQEALDWAKEKEDVFLNQSDAEMFKDTIKMKLSQKFEIGCNLQYMEKLEEYGISYNENLNELISFLGLPPFLANKDKILHLQTNEILLTALKIHQTLNSFVYFDEKDRFIFNPLASLIRMENCDKHVSKAFSSTTDVLIIVEKEASKGAQNFCNTLREIISKPDKKIVIISNEASQLLTLLSTSEIDASIKISPQKMMYEDLTEKSQNMIMQNTVINFQGNDVSLQKLLNNDEASELIDSVTLQDIISGKQIFIGKPLDTFKKIESECYRPRQIRLIEVDTIIFNETDLPENNLFAIESLGIKNTKFISATDFILNDSNKEKIFIILEESKAEMQFQDICNKRPTYCIHWLKTSGNKLVWHSELKITVSVDFLAKRQTQNF